MSHKNTKTSISEKSKKKEDEISVYCGHHTAKAEFIGNTNKARIKILDQTCLDWLLTHDSISLDNYKILDRFYSDFCKAGFVGVKASNYNPRITATYDGSSDNNIVLRRKVLDCFAYVKDTGNKTADIILKKIIHDEEITKWENSWIEVDSNFDFICHHVEKFYKFWGNS
jgi:hypothetical protein